MVKNISVVIITKNEADRISRCINSVKSISDDILVLDSGSEDGTKDLARQLGAKVISTEWKGYGLTKNIGNNKAKYDWIVSLDADEYLSKDLINEISQLELTLDTVYAINRRNFYLGSEIKHSGWSPDWVLRIFNRNQIKWNDSLVHERLIVPQKVSVQKLDSLLYHNSYRSVEDHKAKVEKYAKLRAHSWIQDNKSPGLFKKTLGPLWKGLNAYIFKLGFLDGSAGIKIAAMNIYLVRRQLYHYNILKNEVR